ncbi:AraC family transcriptional regulator [Aquimarina amphilecti]|uniref:AraC family transcriptional regulator n=1 Tax=Aquimarina amphilecti TaxID=1038014 RepID=A0A1H7XDU2_AQUAM|nr:AraC family transcriptional regulator [Aquimarina amphilecti]SEM32052.1 AraC family transcriptional regulator [Aquimarina amphilecti]
MKFYLEQKSNKEYIHRINLALGYIDEHLDSDLSLDIVADISMYSPYHFHRIFKAVIGETLNIYINRKRIEKMAAVLMHQKEVSITELSMQYGFNSNSSFTRAFKKFYGVSPTKFRKQLPDTYSKISKAESKIGQQDLIFDKYICNINNHINWIKMNAKIEVKKISDLHFASVTHIGVNGIENAFNTILKWARSKGILENPEAKMARIFHDSFKITSPDKVRMSVAILMKESFTTENEITPVSIKNGKCIVGSFEITPDDFEKSWSSLFVWMSEQGYQKEEEKPFEIYHNDFREHPDNKCLVDFYIPIK